MPKLSEPLRKKIKNLYSEGYRKEKIFNLVHDEALKEIEYEDEVWRCINRIVSDAVLKKYPLIEFDASKYSETIRQLETYTPKEFEIKTSWIAKEILEMNNFKKVEDANGSNDLKFNNPPFDFFGFKNGNPHIIEYKGRKDNFARSQKDQRQRQIRILDELNTLKSALIQINFQKEKYRILYDEQIDNCYPAFDTPMDSIKDWITSRLKNKIPS
jgi:hypothetical protein